MLAVIFNSRLFLFCVVLLFGCGSGEKVVSNSSKQTCIPSEGRVPLTQENFYRMFEKNQAAYYIEEKPNLLLAVRVKEGLDKSEIMGKFISIIFSKFDFLCDNREKLILICYTGLPGERKNLGVMFRIQDIRKMQEGKIKLDELTEMAKFSENLDLSSITPMLSH